MESYTYWFLCYSSSRSRMCNDVVGFICSWTWWHSSGAGVACGDRSSETRISHDKESGIKYLHLKKKLFVFLSSFVLCVSSWHSFKVFSVKDEWMTSWSPFKLCAQFDNTFLSVAYHRQSCTMRIYYKILSELDHGHLMTRAIKSREYENVLKWRPKVGHRC